MSDAAQTITLQELFNRNWQTFVIDGYDPCGIIIQTRRGSSYTRCVYRRSYIDSVKRKDVATKLFNNPAPACSVGLGIPDCLIGHLHCGASRFSSDAESWYQYFQRCKIQTEFLMDIQRVHDSAYIKVMVEERYSSFSAYFRTMLEDIASKWGLAVLNGRQL